MVSDWSAGLSTHRGRRRTFDRTRRRPAPQNGLEIRKAMATIESYTLKNGERRYQVRYRRPNNLQTKKRGFATKKAAAEFAAGVEVSKIRGEYIERADSRVAVEELGATWLSRQTHLKPSSYRPIESAWRIHVAPRWAQQRIVDIRFTEVQQWVSEMTRHGS